VADVTLEQLVDWLGRFRDLVTEKKDYLTELDSAIGDADHGSNMARGMKTVMEKVEATPAAAIDELFKTVGMTLVSSVGGASGPLYGTFFLRIGTTAGAVTSLTSEEFGAALRAGLEGVLARGKAEVGDKTMLDALVPALDAWDSGGPQAAFDAAVAGRDATEPLEARKGRASYLGERSVGHLDPGATSTALLFEALAGALA